MIGEPNTQTFARQACQFAGTSALAARHFSLRVRIHRVAARKYAFLVLEYSNVWQAGDHALAFSQNRRMLFRMQTFA
jgi:hypothetical protein